MLVLARRIDESIIITLPDGQIITVMVTDAIENKVRIGIDAPNNLTILREEISCVMSLTKAEFRIIENKITIEIDKKYPSLFLTIKEAAEALGTSRQNLGKCNQFGLPPVKRVGVICI